VEYDAAWSWNQINGHLLGDNWRLKEALGLAGYRMQKTEGIAKSHAAVIFGLVYLQGRSVRIQVRDCLTPLGLLTSFVGTARSMPADWSRP
jgi:hypothetical protein